MGGAPTRAHCGEKGPARSAPTTGRHQAPGGPCKRRAATEQCRSARLNPTDPAFAPAGVVSSGTGLSASPSVEAVPGHGVFHVHACDLLDHFCRPPGLCRHRDGEKGLAPSSKVMCRAKGHGRPWLKGETTGRAEIAARRVLASDPNPTKRPRMVGSAGVVRD
jgi:hypothetical protein